ncbi:hypothetical protein CHS0354_028515 [Potamilus streckersoni]|uniref:Methyltransferase FkbM domain-containing protein n=1 Tax=Potamilus streckersoni TaxID=2493646 RepID=A0AAE0VGX6_9BIVA|nr:hypothetical protein CHS0354_028515 [Potamilus streckersoni]
MSRHFRNCKVIVVSVLIFLATFTFYLTIVRKYPSDVINKPFQPSSKSFVQASRDFIPISDKLGLIPIPNRKNDPVIAPLHLVSSKPAAVRLSSGPVKIENMGWNNLASDKSVANSYNDPTSDKSIAKKWSDRPSDMSIAYKQRSEILHETINPTDPGKKLGAHYLDVERDGLVPLKTNDNARSFSIEFNSFHNNIVHEKTSGKESYQILKDSIPIQLFDALSQDKAEKENIRMRNFISGNIQQKTSQYTMESTQQHERHWEGDRDINSMNHILNENAQYKHDIKNINTRSQQLPAKGKHIIAQKHSTESSSLNYYHGPDVYYHSPSTTTSAPSIIEDSSKMRVQKFAAFNLTHNEDMRHIYTLHNLYPSSEGRRYMCIPTRTIPSFTICVFSVQKDIYVSGSLLQTGIWDLKQTQLIQRALNEFPEATFIDVGANIGYFSLLARAMGRTVIAIEPTDANFLRLQEGVVRNKFSDNILMLKYAISDERTTVVMGEDEHNQGGIAVAREISGPANISMSVEAITLDDLVNLILTKEIIIKMDIEGYECKALYSSMELLEKFKVRYIFMEWLIMPQNQDKKDTPCPRVNILHTLANMYSMGFKPYSVHGRELDINNSGSWKTSDIYWKPDDSPRLDEVHVFN